jgi:glycosyltransferase involved in cell wall biosynthesis
LGSLETQTFNTFEAIIVDGGSTDQTTEIISDFIRERPNYTLMVFDGANRAKSRNIGIATASSELIACTDAGVVLAPNWLESLITCFREEEADFVSGVYVGTAESLLQRAIIELQYPNIDQLKAKTFLPSSRSIAFKKQVWKELGGYPENFIKAEDTYFDLKAMQSGYNIVLAKNAKVYWPPRNSLKNLFSQYFSYAAWDAKAGLITHLKLYRKLVLAYFTGLISIFMSYFLSSYFLVILFCIVCSYLIISGITLFFKTQELLSFLIGPAVKVTIFFASSTGLLKGLLERYSRHNNPSIALIS